MTFLKMLIRIVPAALALCALTGCATTEISSTWKDPAYHGHPNRIMVIGMTKQITNRRVFEDEFVRLIKSRGTDAVASYTVLPGKLDTDHAAITAAMKRQGTDAVLITRLLEIRTESTYVPGTVDPLPMRYAGWSSRYRFGYDMIYSPGYMAEEQYAVVETSLYDTTDDRLLWSAKSRTELKGADHQQIKSIVKALVTSMTEEQILKPVR